MKLQFDTGPQLPLSERPIQAEVSLQDLFRWHFTAEAQAKAIGAAFVQEDDGPSAEDLLVRVLQPHVTLRLTAAHQVHISVEQTCTTTTCYSPKGSSIVMAFEPWHGQYRGKSIAAVQYLSVDY